MKTKAKRGKAIIGIAMAAVMLASLVTLVPAVSAEAPENESFKLTLISIFISTMLTIVAIVITAVLTNRATNKTIAKMEENTNKTLRGMIEILDIGSKRSSVAMTYAMRKSEEGDRMVKYEDLHDGYEFADKFFNLKRESKE